MSAIKRISRWKIAGRPMWIPSPSTWASAFVSMSRSCPDHFQSGPWASRTGASLPPRNQRLIMESQPVNPAEPERKRRDKAENFARLRWAMGLGLAAMAVIGVVCCSC